MKTYKHLLLYISIFALSFVLLSLFITIKPTGYTTGTIIVGSSTSTTSTSSTSTSTSTIPGGTGGGGGTTPGCTSSWSCGPWSECINAYQSRLCQDLNKCNVITTRTETQYCGTTPSNITSSTSSTSTTTIELEQPQPTPPRFKLPLLIILIISIITFIAYLAVRYIKKEKEQHQPQLNELYSYIEKARSAGYSEAEIRDALLKADWPKDSVKKALKEK